MNAITTITRIATIIAGTFLDIFAIPCRVRRAHHRSTVVLQGALSAPIVRAPARNPRSAINGRPELLHALLRTPARFDVLTF
jgi:hypothetical protein